MTVFWIVIAILFGLAGIVGSIVPAIPGPPLTWIGLLIMYFLKGTDGAGEPMSTTFLLIWLGITTVVVVLDYVVPSWFTRLTGGSKWAGWGAMAGLLAGMFIPPVGIIVGSLAGAFLAELMCGEKGATDSIKSAFGAFMGFLFGTGLKLMTCGLMLYYIIVYI